MYMYQHEYNSSEAISVLDGQLHSEGRIIHRLAPVVTSAQIYTATFEVILGGDCGSTFAGSLAAPAERTSSSGVFSLLILVRPHRI